MRDKIAELAQKLYQEDGHSGNIYKKAPIPTLRFYEGKAQEIIEKRRNKMPDIVKMPNGVKLEFPEGVDENAFSQVKLFPLRSLLIKRDGRKFYYCYKIKSGGENG